MIETKTKEKKSEYYKRELENLEKKRRKLEQNYKTSTTKIQHVPYYMRNLEKCDKYHIPNLISIGPIYNGNGRLKRGEEYKLMWASMYAEETSRTPEQLLTKIDNNIKSLRGLFSPELVGILDRNLAWMLFVDGCAVLQIIEKANLANLSKLEDLKVKVDLQVIVRDLFLLENQLPYEVLRLLSQKDESTLKSSMYRFCELQKMFTAFEFSTKIETLSQCSSPTHLLDCLHKYFLNHKDEHQLNVCQLEEHIQKAASDSEVEGEQIDVANLFDVASTCENKKETFLDSSHKDEHQLNVCQLEEHIPTTHDIQKAASDSEVKGEQIKAENSARTSANQKEKYITYRNIRELKAAAIRVKRKNNISLKNISFSSSFFGGKLHLPPLILDNSTVTVLWNLVAYEMCPDFKNNLEICSYVKFLDLLIDHPEDVIELRSSGILHHNLGSDEEVVELFNAIGSGLLHNPSLYSKIREEVEERYKNKLRIWMAEAYYLYFRSPWTIVALLAAIIALVLTAIQTGLAF